MKRVLSLVAGMTLLLISTSSAAAADFVEMKRGESPSELSHRMSHRDSADSDVVVFTRGGKAVLPDLEKGKSHEGATELSFTYNSPDYPWTEDELAKVQQLIADVYPLIKEVYGNPAFSITVNIRKDPTIAFAGMYFTYSNELVVHDLYSVDPIVHELIHAFRDDLVIGINSYEEGMARAAEVAVLSQLPQYDYFDRYHSYSIDVYYDLNNEPSIASMYGSFSLGFPNRLLKYQQAGYAWSKLLIENKNFLVRFNALYYRLAKENPAISNDSATLRAIASRLIRKPEGENFNTWYERQYILGENPPTGYQTLYKGDTSVLYLFSRDPGGLEYPWAGVNASWEIYSCAGELLLTGTDQTTALGWISFPLYNLAQQYQGKVRIETSFFLPDTVVTRRVFATTGPQTGIFGITNECEGRVGAEKVDKDGRQRVKSVTIRNGAFAFPELSGIAGTFRVKQRGGVERTITKDASDYFVVLGVPYN